MPRATPLLINWSVLYHVTHFKRAVSNLVPSAFSLEISEEKALGTKLAVS